MKVSVYRHDGDPGRRDAVVDVRPVFESARPLVVDAFAGLCVGECIQTTPGIFAGEVPVEVAPDEAALQDTIWQCAAERAGIVVPDIGSAVVNLADPYHPGFNPTHGF